MSGDNDEAGKPEGGDPLDQATIRVRMKRTGDNDKPAAPDLAMPTRPGVVVRRTTGPQPEPPLPEGPTERMGGGK